MYNNAFIDLSKAFEMAEHMSMSKILDEIGV